MGEEFEGILEDLTGQKVSHMHCLDLGREQRPGMLAVVIAVTHHYVRDHAGT